MNKKRINQFKNAESGELYNIDGYIKMPWGATSDLNEVNKTGLYYLYGDRSNENDNMPINNTGDIVAWLRVANFGGNQFIMQTLELGNKSGGDVKVYTRRYNGSKWSAWQLLQPMVELGQVAELDSYIDNGMYSGVISTGLDDVRTFVMVVINNYAAAVAMEMPQNRQVTQFIYELNISWGTKVDAQMKVRTAMVPEGGKMSGVWKTIQIA
ncbi:MAG: hypothetical protein IKB97_02365 [Bacteroidaceae bacterium]|nr:hypothetical protein [Bacteroidaceae bacterium]